ncbi:MAG: ankyrin repeat domain-containing protein [Saprospiraceae bacterium]
MKFPFKAICFGLISCMVLPKLTHATQNNTVATKAICQAILSVPANYAQLRAFAQEGYDLHCNCLVRQHTQFVAMNKTIVNFYDPTVSEYILSINSEKNAYIETIEVTPLYVALSREDYGLLRFLIQNGVNLNKRFSNNLLPIEYVFHENRIKMVRFLLNHGANIGDMEIGCPHNLELTKTLIQSGANPMSIDLNCTTGNDEKYKAAIELLPNLAARTLTQDELNKLFQNPRLLETMIEKGLDVNQTVNVFDKDGNKIEHSLLVQAIQNQNENVIDLLLKHGANVNATNHKGWTPIFHAIKTNRLSVVKKLINNGAIVTWISDSQNDIPLNLAVQLGYKTIVNELLIAGAKPYLKLLRKEDLPLVRAFNNNDKSIIELLLKYTTSKEWNLIYYFAPETIIYQTNKLKYALSIGMRADDELLQIAIVENQSVAASLILKHKANWETNNTKDETALYTAFDKGNIAIASELIKSGIDVNATIEGKNPLLIQAIEQNSFILVSRLLSNNATLNILDMNGQSALHIAIQKNNYDIIKLLIDSNIDIDCDDVLLATKQQNVSVLKLLKEKLGKLDCKIDGKSLRYHTREIELSYEVKILVKGNRFF